jgi:hypothetical protein
MKALTLWPEWIPAILHYGKRVENRPWRPSGPLRDLALHSGMRVSGGANAREACEGVAAAASFATGQTVRAITDIAGRVTLGAIVAVVDVRNYVTSIAELQPDQRAWFFGPHGWVLDNVRILTEPVYCRGHQGLWPVPEDTDAEVRRRLP